jgi:hypothetical protein
MNTRPLRIAALALVALASAQLAQAQITTGSVAGTVKDGQGGVIPGATVTLMNEAQGTRSTPVVTSPSGDFVFANVSSGTYAIEVEMPSFKKLKRSGIGVGAGERVAVGALILEVGGTEEVVDVRGEAALIQATTGDRSFTVTTDPVENLPIASRSFTALATLAPGVSGMTRIGGGGTTFVMMDGISAVDTGSNGAPILQMNVESIAEVKVLTSTYQAEYGRSSGLQITAVTKSGTNRFRGSLYDVERNSDWNSNSKVNKLNGDQKPVTKERDWGYSIGGPVGKPGGNNKLFFFYAQEFEPRTAGNNVVRFRMPTALERQGDFSQTIDNNGNLYPYIKDPNLSGACDATSQVACFRDEGVLGRIPSGRLYQTGLNILKLWPLPNIAGAPGQSYNFELTRPTESILSWQPALRIDYQPTQKLRATFKYSGWQQRNQTINGTLPGFNDTKMQRPVVSSWVTTINYTFSPSTFFEATYGRSQDELAGCALAQQSTGPLFCTSAVPMGAGADRRSVGLENLPMLFPDANVINPDYYAYEILNFQQPPYWDGTRIWKVPSFSWGSRIVANNNNQGASITGRIVSVHDARPPVLAIHTGPPVPQCWVALNNAVTRQGVYTAPCLNTAGHVGEFTILNVSPGTYELVVWDEPLDTIIGFTTVTVGTANVDLRDIPQLGWFGRYQGRVFQDIDGTGLPYFREAFDRPYVYVNPMTGVEEVRQQPFAAGDLKPALGAGVASNIRFRDGSIYQSTTTKDDGTFAHTEVFPFFNWTVAEIDYARFKATSANIVVDNGGPINAADNLSKLWGSYTGLFGSNNPALAYNPWTRINPQPQRLTDGALTDGGLFRMENCGESGQCAILLEGMSLYANQTNHIEWGKVPYTIEENGGIAGIVYYGITRAEDDPRYAAAENWEPGIPRVQVNVFLDCDGDGKVDKPKNDGTGQCEFGATGLSLQGYVYVQPDVDNYPFCWRDAESAADPTICPNGKEMGPEDVMRVPASRRRIVASSG